MSQFIVEAFVKQFSDSIFMLAEQKTSRLRRIARTETVTGEAWTVERLGSVEVSEILNRHGPTEITDTPHDRRWGFIRDYDVADLIDWNDLLKIKIAPQDKYVQRHASAMGRAIDRVLIDALNGSVIEGKNGQTTTNFDSDQEIVANSDHLTIDKIVDAWEMLNASEVDESIPRFLVANARDLANLVRDDNHKVGNSEYALGKVLATGDFPQWMGFTIIRSELLPILSGGTVNTAFACAWGGIELGLAKEPSSSVDKRPDRRNSWQLYTGGSWGAVRTEDSRVVRILSTRAFNDGQ